MRKYLVNNGNLPEFDWVLLGIGEDGHTASLFPNTADLDSEDLTLLILKPNTSEYRVSLSSSTFRAAKRISYLVTGKSKATVVSEVIYETGDFNSYPAYLVRAESGATEYLLDRQASSLLVS
jgi:6-phosphogluconolactonase